MNQERVHLLGAALDEALDLGESGMTAAVTQRASGSVVATFEIYQNGGSAAGAAATTPEGRRWRCG